MHLHNLTIPYYNYNNYCHLGRRYYNRRVSDADCSYYYNSPRNYYISTQKPMMNLILAFSRQLAARTLSSSESTVLNRFSFN